MRRNDIVRGILLIPSIIDFALAAPVLVQEKRQASVDMVDIPRDVITVLEKRASEEVEKVFEELFGSSESPVELSDAHLSSSSAPPAPDHGSKNNMDAPAPDAASLPTSPEPLMEPDLEDQPPSKRPKLASSKESAGQVHEDQVVHAQQPNPRPLPDPNPYSDLTDWFDLDNLPPLKQPVSEPWPEPSSLTWNEFGQGHVV